MSNSILPDIYSSKTQGITTTTAIQGKDASAMGMNDFFSLLAAQMSNQDMTNPQENTEFIAQMAQFSSLQAMNNLLEYQQTANALSYVGKEVTIAEINETTGSMESITGLVSNVTFYDGKPKVVVNGTSYDAFKVMSVNTPASADTSGNALTQYTSYIGKTVTLTDITDPLFPKDLTGIVDSVTLKGGKPFVIVGGNEYPASAITFVGDKGDYDYNDVDTGSTGDDTNTDVDTDKVDGTDGDSELDTDDDIGDDDSGEDITDAVETDE